MQIAYHLRIHGSDDDRMLKSLLQNRELLQKNDTDVIPPSRLYGVLSEAMSALQGGTATPEMEQIMLDAILTSEDPHRVVCSMPGFLGGVAKAINPNGLYYGTAARIASMANLFPSYETEFFLPVRNPVTLLQGILTQSKPQSFEALMQNVDPMTLRWAPTIQQFAQTLQGRRLVIWRHEDSPLIWPEILRLISQINPSTPIKGGMTYMRELLSPVGNESLQKELADRDQLSISTRRDICVDHLQRFALPGNLEDVITLPGWTQEMVDEVTENYHRDTAEIAALPGVEFLLP